MLMEHLIRIKMDQTHMNNAHLEHVADLGCNLRDFSLSEDLVIAVEA